MKPKQYEIDMSQPVPGLEITPFPKCWTWFREMFVSYRESPIKKAVKHGFLGLMKPFFKYIHKQMRREENFFTLDRRQRFKKSMLLNNDRTFLELSGTSLLEDDPNAAGPLERAASLTIAALNVYRTIQKGTVLSSTPMNMPLDYSQFHNEFAGAFVPRNGTLEFVRHQDTTHICILCRGDVYKLEVLKQGKIISPNLLLRRLRDIADRSVQSENPVSVGDLSALKVSGYLEMRKLLSQHPENDASFAELESALFVLALDLDTEPGHDEAAARQVFIENKSNRFYFVPAQIVVLKNRQAGMIHGFSAYLDAFTNILFASWIYTDACYLDETDIPFFDEESEGDEPEPLTFNIPATLDRETFALGEQWNPEQSIYDIDGVGTNFFKSRRMSADSAVHVAVIWATYRIYKRFPKAFEMLDMKAVRGGTVLLPLVLTREIEKFIHHLEAADGTMSQARSEALLREAVTSHKAVIRATKAGGDPMAILMWSVVFQPRFSGLLRLPIFAFMIFARLNGFSKPDVMTANLSNIKVRPGVKFTGRPGTTLTRINLFAAHFLVLEDTIRFIFIPAASETGTVKEIHREIGRCLEKIQEILG